jgi:N-acetylmuramoyl-L-alanine amidase
MAKKICIDAGHYGKYNRSPANKSYYESDMVWKLHLLQKKYLEEYGFEVITTRSKQASDLDLHKRGTKSKGCDLFISDHSNATGSGVNETTDHVAVYHLTDDKTTKCDDISKEIAQKLAPVIADVMDTKGGYKVLTRKAGNDRNGDGIMNDNYYGVLHGARTVGTPALILEHSFHTNTRSTNWLLKDDNLDKLAKAEADAIAEYFGMTKIPEKETEKADSELFRVQVGAYSKIKNAEDQLAKVKAAGFKDAIMVLVDGLYKIQVGAYSVKTNADTMLAKVEKAGFEAFITTKGGKTVTVSSALTPKVQYYARYFGTTSSIVTALNSLKIGSSFANRKKIAKANGITLYLGTAAQNTKLLNLLKQGKLIKP